MEHLELFKEKPKRASAKARRVAKPVYESIKDLVGADTSTRWPRNPSARYKNLLKRAGKRSR